MPTVTEPVRLLLAWQPPWGVSPVYWQEPGPLADDAVLYICLHPLHLPDCEAPVEALGFTWRTVAAVASRMPTRPAIETGPVWCGEMPLLAGLGVRGKPKRASAGVHQVVEAGPEGALAAVANQAVRLMGDVPRAIIWPGAVDPPAGWAMLPAPQQQGRAA